MNDNPLKKDLTGSFWRTSSHAIDIAVLVLIQNTLQGTEVCPAGFFSKGILSHKAWQLINLKGITSSA